jgi:predicted glutamine amidotransferase
VTYYQLVSFVKKLGWSSKYVHKDKEVWIKGDKTITVAMTDGVPRAIKKQFMEANMCKVLIIPTIKEDKRELTEQFIKNMAAKMSSGNSDGLGYAGLTKTGDLFAERWFKNAQAFTYSSSQEVETSLYEMFGPSIKEGRPTAIVNKVEYSSFNSDYSLQDAVSITLHARFATCEKSLTNVHPFIKNDTSVIHNGVIRNFAKFNLEQSTCDSEAILLGYLANSVGSNPGAVQALTTELIGYYVAAMYSRDANGNRILDVFNGNNTNLYIASIKELDTYVMSTSDFDIKAVCHDLGLTVVEMYQMLDDQFMRINPFTGEVVERSGFTGSAQYETKNVTTVYPQPNYNNWKTYRGDGEVETHNRMSKRRKSISEMELKYLMKPPKIEVLSHADGVVELGMLGLLTA